MRICPNCNAEVENNFNMCWNCQYSFDAKKILDESDFKVICPGCNREIESSLDYCPHCQYDLRELNEQNDTPSKFPKHIDCLRCNVELEYQGNFKFNEKNVGTSGNLSELFTNRDSFDLYCCPACGKIEFFLPEVEEHVGQTTPETIKNRQ